MALGTLARSATTRARLVASAGWATLPKITSSRSAGSTVERGRASEAATRPSSCAGTWRNAPHDLTKGVRAPPTMTAPGTGRALLGRRFRRGLRRGAGGGVLAQSVLLQLLVEVAARSVDRLGGGGDVPVEFPELFHEELALGGVLELLQRVVLRRRGAGGGHPAAAQPGQVLERDRLPLGHDQQALDRALELPHVAPPGERAQLFQGVGIERLGLAVVVLGEARREKLDQPGDVAATLAQRRDRDDQRVDAEVEVL